MPLFLAKKEVYAWIKEGKKTIDVRKGNARRGEIAVFQSGANSLRLPIVKKETGKLAEVIRKDNYQQVVPSAENLEAAIGYLCDLYGACGGVFTAYYLSQSN
jgi:ASC-1-like (ASCH) protein